MTTVTKLLRNAVTKYQTSALATNSIYAPRRHAATAAAPVTFEQFTHLNVSRPAPFVVHVQLNRPKSRNSLNQELWSEIGRVFDLLATDTDCRSIVVSAAGPVFCAGLDFTSMAEFGGMMMDKKADVGRRAHRVGAFIDDCQRYFTSIERCARPVVAAVNGGCIGAGLGLLTATDVRYASADAYFSIKEVDIGIAADVGTLQRMPKIIGNGSLMREMAFTARNVYVDEAMQCGLLSRVFATPAETVTAAIELARVIATKSPVAVQGSKVNLNYARDHSVDDALLFHKTFNMSQLQSDDLIKAAMAAVQRQKEPPVFDKL